MLNCTEIWEWPKVGVYKNGELHKPVYGEWAHRAGMNVQHGAVATLVQNGLWWRGFAAWG